MTRLNPSEARSRMPASAMLSLRLGSASTSPRAQDSPDKGTPASGSESAGPAVAAPPAPARTPPRPQTLPPFRVLLHNDDKNDLEYVIATVCELTTLGRPRAVVATMEADKKGIALLLVTHKERAELYQEQFTSKGLTVTIEPAE